MKLRPPLCHRATVAVLLFCLVILLCGCQGQTEQEAAHDREKRRRPFQRQQQQQQQREQRRQDREQKRQERQQQWQERRSQWRQEREERAKERKEKWQETFGGNKGKSPFNFTSSSLYDSYASVFPTQPPRDLVQGVWNAMKSTIVGSLIGMASFLVFPFALFTKSGVLGFVGGAMLGSLAGLFATLTGILTGAYHLIFGLIRTPVSLHASWSGKRWDPDEREWHYYNLQQEAEALLSSRHYRNNNRVQDLTYYDLLEVPTNATAKEIKRAYYRKAKRFHPDKNPNDEEAAAKFLQLHTAYQTLLDDDKRATYDEWGASSTDGGSTWHFNVEAFFAMLFGSQLVEPYIGQLTVATFVDQLINLYRSEMLAYESFTLLKDESNYKRQKRQVEVALNLLNRIQPFVSENVTADEFRASCKEEADKIAETGFGEKFLTIIGSNLILQAGLYLGFRRSILGWPSGLFFFASTKKRGIKNRMRSFQKTARVIWNLIGAIKSDDSTNDIKSSNEEEAEPQKKKKRIPAEHIEKMLPQILEMAWAHNVQDIAMTLDGACWKLFDDSGVGSSSKRIKRAEAIQILGEEFALRGRTGGDRGTCPNNEMDATDIKVRLEVAFKVAHSQKHGEKMTSEASEEMIKEARRTS